MRYMLITFLRRPGGQIDEQVTVAKKVKLSDRQTCNVIIDYKTKTVEKCVVEGNVVDTDYTRLNEYYKKIYPVVIAQLEKANAAETALVADNQAQSPAPGIST